MPAWPVTLPAPQAPGYTLSPGDQTIRTDMEVGSPRVRRRTTARNDKLAVGWVLTDAQLDDLRDWFDDDVTGIAGGSAWFTALLAVGTGTTQASVEARFDGPFKADRNGPYWNVAATLETR